jgi:hypothetical protein
MALSSRVAKLVPDTQILKFNSDGKFLLQLGKHGVHNGSNDPRTSGSPRRSSPIQRRMRRMSPMAMATVESSSSMPTPAPRDVYRRTSATLYFQRCWSCPEAEPGRRLAGRRPTLTRRPCHDRLAMTGYAHSSVEPGGERVVRPVWSRRPDEAQE